MFYIKNYINCIFSIYMFLALLHWLGSPGQCWIETLRIDILAFLILGETIQSFTNMYEVSWRFFIDALYQIEEVFIQAWMYYCSWKESEGRNSLFFWTVSYLGMMPQTVVAILWSWGELFLRSKTNPLMKGVWRDGDNLGPLHGTFPTWDLSSGPFHWTNWSWTLAYH